MVTLLKKITNNEVFRRIFYFFPVQLVFVHIKNNQILFAFWLILIGFMSESVASKYGVPYLFLTPEYLGHTGFLAYFILGFSFGGFIMAFNISSYIMNGHRFPFIATLSMPFYKYFLNNLFWGGSLVVFYIICTVRFLVRDGATSTLDIILYIIGFCLGLGTLIFLNLLYFVRTNKDIDKVSGKKLAQKHFMGTDNPIKAVFHKKIKWETFFNPDREWTIQTYLSHPNKISIARSTDHYDGSMLKQVFEQNHLNAALFEIIVFVSIIALSFGSDFAVFNIPAGASLMLMFTMFIMLTSAIHSWFRGWAPAIMIVLFLGFNYLSQFDFFNPPNKAYGLNYETAPAQFDEKLIAHNINPDYFQKDFEHTLKILENWRKKNNAHTVKTHTKPKMIFINTTGGGMRAGLWSFYVTQYLDSISSGELFKHTQLISGSSGGLLGLAYLRELKLREQRGEITDFYNRAYCENIAKDILNRLGFAWTVNDLVFKFRSFDDGDYSYKKDRGYAFEQQLNENTGGVLDKRLWEYYKPEFNSEIPMMLISPTIVNDGRRLMISPQPTSYLSYVEPQDNISNDFLIDAIEFKRFFEYQDARNIKFTSALRMSSTFPYVMPLVHLPSEPVIEVMDAGIRDNHGIKNSLKFLYTFRNWIATNTSGVIFVQIRDTDKEIPLKERKNNTFVKSLSSPVGSVYKNLFLVQDFDHDQMLQYASEWFEGNIEMIDLVLHHDDKNSLSLSWHLTPGEKRQVYNSIKASDNQYNIKRFKELMQVK